MARTPSNMLPLGTVLPEFSLTDTISGEIYNSKNLQTDNLNKGSLIMFICNHCPFVIHIIKEIESLGKLCKSLGVNVIAISSNDISNYPEDSPDNMTKFANNNGFNFPYLFDETQNVAKAFDAACTPDFYLFDSENRLVYRGQLDDSRPGNDIPITGKDLKFAIECLTSGKKINEDQKPSMGCNIKWKN